MTNSPRTYGTSGVLLICGVILLFNIPRVARALKVHRMAKNPARAPGGAAAIWYGRMITAMARRGHKKSPTQTPVEFVEKIEDVKLRNGVARFTNHYERARFNDSAEDAVELPKIYEELTK